MSQNSLRGRGAAFNPPNRFETLHLEPMLPGADDFPDEEVAPQTQVFWETAKTILAHNDSPDIGFDTSINAYLSRLRTWLYLLLRASKVESKVRQMRGGKLYSTTPISASA